MIEGYFTVTSLNNYIKMVLERDENLAFLYLRAEISSFKKQASTGHCYLTIKDENSVMNAIMFSSSASKLTFNPKDGDDVMIIGKLSSYPQRGQYQVYIYEMNLFGQGKQLLELEKLKKKLQAEGLFDESHKRPINRFPKKVGVITANNSAALSDIIKNTSRRWPMCEIYVFPSLVQGLDAPKDLLRAFKLSQNYDLDTLIIGRGGGANEDLSAFNDEALVRAVYNSKMPVISAVGHEIDTTLIDFVADKRASTPTAACEFATCDISDIRNQIMMSDNIMIKSLQYRINNLKHRLEIIKANQFFVDPKSIYKEKLINLKDLDLRLNTAIDNYFNIKKQEIKLKKQRFESLNPKSVLSRGYAMLENKDKKVISSIKDVENDDIIYTSLKDGTIKSKVIEKGE